MLNDGVNGTGVARFIGDILQTTNAECSMHTYPAPSQNESHV